MTQGEHRILRRIVLVHIQNLNLIRESRLSGINLSHGGNNIHFFKLSLEDSVRVQNNSVQEPITSKIFKLKYQADYFSINLKKQNKCYSIYLNKKLTTKMKITGCNYYKLMVHNSKERPPS